MDLFSQHLSHHHTPSTPLAERLRPKTLDEFVGQTHLLGDKKILRNLFQSKTLFPMILWGPPGSGKTTLANLLARETASEFIAISAVTANVKDLKEIMQAAQERLKLYRKKTILFIDEIHRFNKAQQDYLLPFVEQGTVILIGATTENPSFEINAPLLSRTKVIVLKRLEPQDLTAIIERALKVLGTTMDPLALQFLADSANGDARSALNTVAVSHHLSKEAHESTISLSIVEEALQKKNLYYDKKAEEHYNIISAFHKSMRGSDPDAAIYWLCRMIEAGEDPLFIARRMVVFASEDVGNADPHALPLAVATMQAVDFIGMPEAKIPLAQAATYLATAPKSNASYAALLKATEDIKATGNLDVPLYLRNAPTKLMKELGYSKGYQYAHDQKDKKVTHPHLPEKLQGKKYYLPPQK
ncbi:MAG: AAA family ATPase [Deltaproteobacteria bacterium GWA2_38_16]|nr:MAG: AAA family ATPase [Deltaproteobacteria bacterium GWA2_38_16]OGQ02089.1 MAG: AAA family ATPase [Deltaproteobacteria bacterium RIFCSPHIGHO2_02_FULL_38_15]OGQ63066.1 MAG: AAA family ATPase [Deltaproteobacteria bacterium RIFCSPLOWO2_12_FULL_38_8]HBQ21627.1 AAA family ATPase [Deltaproteobacteria bacterium]